MEQATVQKLAASDLELVELSHETGVARIEEIAALTGREARELEHTVFSAGTADTRAFGALAPDGRLLGFQAWIAKPLRLGENRHHSFRSEYTIISPELRGTGAFGHFYPWSMDRVRAEFGDRVYFWGESGHRAWAKLDGWKQRTGYSYYQLYGDREFTHPGVEGQMRSRPYRVARAALRALSPPVLRRSRHPVEIVSSLPFAEFERYEAADPRPTRARLAYDEPSFIHRFERNPLVSYVFATCGDALVIVGEKDGRFGISDIYARRYSEYVAAVDALLESRSNLVVHANVFSEWPTPAFRANIRLGFVTLIGGGSFWDHGAGVPELELRRLPLHEAYHFGRDV